LDVRLPARDTDITVFKTGNIALAIILLIFHLRAPLVLLLGNRNEIWILGFNVALVWDFWVRQQNKRKQQRESEGIYKLQGLVKRDFL
jgi:hypothetical protein